MIIGLTYAAGVGANELAMRWRYESLGTLCSLWATGRQHLKDPVRLYMFRERLPIPGEHGFPYGAALRSGA